MAVYSVESVRVLDLSPAGVFLQAGEAVEVGSRGVLRLSVAGAPFAAEVEVRRVVSSAEAQEEYRFAAQFVEITPKHRQLIERFISQ